MFQYFLRRLLLTIPTFIGCTLVVFVIVQLAPGGPIEQQIQALKRGGGETSVGSDIAGQSLPKEAIEELKRFYNFDKPVYVRYLMWLGLMPREVETYELKPGERRLVGEGKSAIARINADGTYTIANADNSSETFSEFEYEVKKTSTGETRVRVFRRSISGILQGDFGKSYQFRKPVLELIADRMPISIQFGIIGFVLSYVICVYLGIQKALRHNSRFDFITSSIVLIANSIPGWALGAVLLVLLCTSSFLEIFPLGGFQSNDYDTLDVFSKIVDRAIHFVLPLIAYVTGGFATLTLLMKNSLLDNLSQDYIRTAFAKGIREQRVIWLHAMRNSIIPIAANIGYIIGVLLASNYLIETVFNIDGLGKLTFESVVARDYPVVFCFTVISVFITLIGSIISDLVISFVDPRIRFS